MLLGEAYFDLVHALTHLISYVSMRFFMFVMREPELEQESKMAGTDVNVLFLGEADGDQG